MAVTLNDLQDACGKQVRVKLHEQALPIEGRLLDSDHMQKSWGYSGDVFGITVGHTTRAFEPDHVQALEVLS